MPGNDLEINENLSRIILQVTGYNWNSREIYNFLKYYRNVYINVSTKLR